MRLPETFYRLPHLFDAERLAEEVRAFDRSEWRPHPGGFEYNSALILISAHGGQNDSFGAAGPMLPTPALARAPYLMQVLASLGLPLSRSRLMQVDAGKQVPLHDDVHLHWFRRVRVHIPIITTPSVRFSCGDDAVHMGPGECWIFDNFELHRVDNDGAIDRVHLCVDVAGDQLFERYGRDAIPISRRAEWGQPGHVRRVPYRPGQDDSARITCEDDRLDLLSPADLDELSGELAELEAELAADPPSLAAWRAGLVRFRASWAEAYRELAHTRDNLPRFAEPIRAWVADVERMTGACPIALDLDKNRRKARGADAYRVIRSMLQVTAQGWSTAR